MLPPLISAVVTLPKSAIVVPAKVLFCPTTICSLSVVVTNFIYESVPSFISSAVARLSLRVTLLVPVFPLNTISKPVAAVSVVIVSHPMEPTLVMLPSDTFKLVPTIAANVPAAALVAPITVPSMVPPLMSVVVRTELPNVTIPDSAILPAEVPFLAFKVDTCKFVVSTVVAVTIPLATTDPDIFKSSTNPITPSLSPSPPLALNISVDETFIVRDVLLLELSSI